MREIIGLVIGLYLTVALVVGGGGAYAFMTHTTKPPYKCDDIDLRVTAGAADGMQGSPNWVPWVVWRGAAWPYRYWVEREETKNIPDWLLVQYDPFPTACGRAARAR